MKFRINKSVVLGVIAIGMMGCGGSDQLRRYSLNGEVTYQGQPIPYAEMLLTPDSSKQKPGPGSIVEVLNGKFTLDATKGHIGGPYTATITGFDGKAPTTTDPLRPTLKGKVVFENYKTEFDLPKSNSSHNIDITASKKNH